VRAAIAAVAAAVILGSVLPATGTLSSAVATPRGASIESPAPDGAETTAPSETPSPAAPEETPLPSESPEPEPTDPGDEAPDEEAPDENAPDGESPEEDVPADVAPGARALLQFSAPVPTMTGGARDGMTLTAQPGTWTPTPTTVVYQWRADNRAIKGGSTRTITVGPSLVGKRISVAVIGSREGYESKAVLSVQTNQTYKGVTDEALLLSKIKKRLDEHGWKYTVAVRELTGAKRSTSVYGGTQREPASTSKLFIAYAVLDRIDDGRLALSTKTSSGRSVKDCLRVLIEVSDNYCARDLMAVIGRSTLNAKLAAEGYTGTQFSSSTNSKGWNKTSTANDLALLLSRLQRNQLLSASGTTHLLTLMERQVWRSRLASGLPEGVRSASKPGELWLSSGMLQLDVGIVYGPTSTYVLTVMGQGNATKAAIKDISKTVFAHLQGYPSTMTTVTYPAEQMRTVAPTALKSTPAGRTIVTVPGNAKVEVVSSQGLWYYVKVGGRTGWINANALRSRWAA
jgi:beta-lactamase class A